MGASPSIQGPSLTYSLLALTYLYLDPFDRLKKRGRRAVAVWVQVGSLLRQLASIYRLFHYGMAYEPGTWY